MIKFIKSKKTGEYIKIDPNDEDFITEASTRFGRTFTEDELKEERDAIIRAIGNPSIEVDSDDFSRLPDEIIDYNGIDAIMNKDQIDKDLAAITIMNAQWPGDHNAPPKPDKIDKDLASLTVMNAHLPLKRNAVLSEQDEVDKDLKLGRYGDE